MDRKIIPFPVVTTNAEDPAMARALIFAEVESGEIIHTVPRAVPAAPKAVY